MLNQRCQIDTVNDGKSTTMLVAEAPGDAFVVRMGVVPAACRVVAIALTLAGLCRKSGWASYVSEHIHQSLRLPGDRAPKSCTHMNVPECLTSSTHEQKNIDALSTHAFSDSADSYFPGTVLVLTATAVVVAAGVAKPPPLLSLGVTRPSLSA